MSTLKSVLLIGLALVDQLLSLPVSCKPLPSGCCTPTESALAGLALQYIAPALYLVKDFEEQLHILFPDRNLAVPTFRYFLNPVNVLWERIKDIHERVFAQSISRVGLQVRTWGEYDSDVSKVGLLGVGQRMLVACKLLVLHIVVTGSTGPLVDKICYCTAWHIYNKPSPTEAILSSSNDW